MQSKNNDCQSIASAFGAQQQQQTRDGIEALSQSEHHCLQSMLLESEDPRSPTAVSVYDVQTSHCDVIHTVSSVVPPASCCERVSSPLSRGAPAASVVVNSHKRLGHGGSKKGGGAAAAATKGPQRKSHKTFVLLHGFSSGAAQFAPNWMSFDIHNGDKVFSMDLPTHGLSSGFTSGTPKVARGQAAAEEYLTKLCTVLQEWLTATVVAEEIESRRIVPPCQEIPRQLVFLGHSFGGYLATHFVSRYFKNIVISSNEKYLHRFTDDGESKVLFETIHVALVDPFGFRPTPSKEEVSTHYAKKNFLERLVAWMWRFFVFRFGAYAVVRFFNAALSLFIKKHTSWAIEGGFPSFQHYILNSARTLGVDGVSRVHTDSMIGAMFTGTSIRFCGEGLTATINAGPALCSTDEVTDEFLLKVKILVVCGADSWLHGHFVKEALDQRRELRQCRSRESEKMSIESSGPLETYIELEGGNHNAHTQKPIEFNTILSEWIDSL